MTEPSPILVTGCSSAVGHALAARLGRAGHLVIATAAQVEPIGDLERAGCRVLRLDTTDEASMVDAVGTVQEEYGPVWGLVSLFGLARLCQLVLPGMRAAGDGRMVVLGPAGSQAANGAGYQAAARDAVRALTAALGQEVRPYGIRVSLVEPGPAPLDQPVTVATRQLGLAAPIQPDRPRSRSALSRPALALQGGVRLAAAPDRVAAVLETALLARHPRARYHTGVAASVTRGARGLLPNRPGGHPALLYP
jgi:NAD(P)-dependent dehydrogenase (short-subunit alcohol dehydrogenase family)